MSQEVLADRIGKTQGMISQWEGGKSDIPMTCVYDLAKALNVTAAQLISHDPRPGDPIYEVWGQLPEAEHARGIRLLKNLADPDN